MCKFCEINAKIDTTIGDYNLTLSLDEENLELLKIRLKIGGMGLTRPIKISYCPFCGENLKEFYCRECSNYNIGDGVEDITECHECRWK